MKRLLLVILCISSVALMCIAMACATRQSAKTEADRGLVPAPTPDNSHLDIPRNCQQTPNADGSVLLTCECEGCGHPEPSDGMNPVPWSCTLRGNAVYCGYNNGNGFSPNDGKNTTRLEYPASDSCGQQLVPCSPAVSTHYALFAGKG